MTITVTPTKIKQSLYLLIPKNIVDLIDVNNKTKFKFSLKIKQNGKKHFLEYETQ